MSKFHARTALDQLVGRPALVSQAYAGQGIGLNSEVTSGNMMADLRELATADQAQEIAASAERTRVLASAYGMDVSSNDKPFIFSDGYALIPIHGLLINRFSWSWGFVTGYNFLRSQVTLAAADPDVKAIIFDINSPGGMVSGCQETADVVFNARGDKPLIAVVDANCHSAAYYLASQCDHIAITPSGSCANIGVVRMHADVSGMMEEMGIKVSFIIAGSHKVDGNPFEPLSDEVRAEFQAEIDATYDEFVAAVVRGRGMDEQDVRDTEARAYGSADALALGLVDAIQNPSDAVEDYFASCEAVDDDADGDTEDDDPPETEESKMAIKPNTPITKPTASATDPAANSEVTSVNEAELSATAQTAERTRIRDITTHAEAKGRGDLANYLAFDTGMSAEAAVAILMKSPKESAAQAPTGTTDETKPTEQSEFKNAMNSGAQPNVGAGGGGGSDDEASGDLTPAQRMLAAQSRATGYKAPATKH